MRERIPFLVFVLSIVILAFSYGFATALRQWPPAPTIMGAYETAEDLWQNWRNDFGFAPTRLLVPARDPRRQRIVVVDEEGMSEGYRFISGLTPHKQSLFGIVLVDAAGSEVHFWPLDFKKLAPRGRSPNNVFPHGIQPMRDGSIIVNFDQGDVLARVSPCGEIMWVTSGNFHHGISLSHDGTIWLWEDQREQESGLGEHIVQIDPETGRRMRQISLERDIITRQELFGRFAILTEEHAERIRYCCDSFHPNDVDVLSPEMAGAFPMFEAGDLLISLRSLNMIAVVDPETARVKWSQIGPWHRQHDPDFLPDGTISVYDNRMGLGASRIVTVDPATGDTQVVFDGARRNDFYSWRRGRHQTLENGNIMIAESEKGRAIEVDRQGQIVWVYDNIYDPERNGPINDALVLPRDFFAEGALTCPRT